MSSPKSGRRWRSRSTEIWRSLTSWTHWYRRRKLLKREQERKVLRRELELRHLMLMEALEAMLPPLLNKAVQEQFMLMLGPLVAALQRQDQLAVQNQEELKELLIEVLNSLQPPVSQQLLQNPPPPSPRSGA